MMISLFVRLATFGLLFILLGSTCAFASDLSRLIDKKCQNCHNRVIKKFKAAGSPHATEVECRDCHTYHPQRDEAPKVNCGACHNPAESEHYQYGNCQQCHHAHWPLDIDFSRITAPVKKNCLSCHDVDLISGPSQHLEQLRCVECHSRHDVIPACLDCHAGHGDDKRLSDCLKCHPAHKPVPATFKDGLDVRLCGACHADTVSALDRAGGAHAVQACTECHKLHGDRPSCLNCHDPHSKVMGAGDCKDCHFHHQPLPLKLQKGISFALCSTCHEEIATTFEDRGSGHKDSLTCSDCHLEHPPGKNVIPKCSMCHDKAENAHFGVRDCTNCHNPHQPQPVEFTDIGQVRPACIACHRQPDQELAEGSSLHAQLDCSSCHTQHAEVPTCLDCHEGHNEKMSAADCGGCHVPHRPSPARFEPGIDAALCADCHEEVAASFTLSGGRHQQSLDCTACHEEHPPAEKAIPDCTKCHDAADSPHFAVEDCSRCHTAHSPELKDLTGLKNLRPVCASCHADVADEMDRVPTAHRDELTCTQCHEQHGDSPSCFDCHQGHDEELRLTGCTQCHNPHRPLPIEFLEGTAAVLCSPCHAQPVAELNSAGGAHKEQFGCIDCHTEHPPAEQVIPKCSDCHDSAENSHFGIAGCVNCHNPHRPVLEDISGLADSRPVCAGCHAEAEEQLRVQVSGHSSQACVDCHQQHADAPSCLDCHEGHGAEMAAADCLSCHQPHAPLQIHLKNEPAAKLCAACHADQVDAIAVAGAGHRDKLDCAACHQLHPAASCAACHSQHPQAGQGIPESCFACHPPSRHPHYAVGDCQDCHAPHQPLELDLQTRKPHTPVCVSCHQQVEEQFAELPGGHSTQDCANCHSEHTKRRKCLDCHEPHAESMSQEDCLYCHSPHQPQDIRFRREDAPPRKFCAPCHAEQASEIAAKGEGHLQELVGCTACHPEHRPNGQMTKLECGSCHVRAQRRHFTLENCSGCHNPHRPLDLDLSGLAEVRSACVSCHNTQERLYKLQPSKHGAFDCRKCHAGEHGATLECLECHDPHIPKMTHLECLKCHPPHFPQLIKAKPGQAGKVCASCHQDAAAKLKEQGSAHKKQPCVSCHQAHPPADSGVLPACSICHDEDDNPHFTVTNCRDCHQGHQPLGHDLSKAADARPACQACHAEVVETFGDDPSAHAGQDCTLCHLRHAEAQKCGDCHEPHTPGMGYADCLSCHSAPHAPTRITFTEAMPSDFCRSCHRTQVEALAATPTRHRELSCVECHQGGHGDKAECSSCHEPPHDPALHRKYPDCLKCHNDPHDLADWRGGAETAPDPSGIKIEAGNQPPTTEAISGEDVK